MRRSTLRLLIGTAFGVAAASSAAWALSDPRDPQTWPFDPSSNPHFGLPGASARNNPGVTAPLVEPPKPEARAAPPSQTDQLNELFGRLAKAGDADEAGSVALLIEHLWLRSGSDTADLLMARAMSALGQGDHAVALSILDRLVALDPTWAEAWNKRATLRFLADNDAGAMEDIAHVLALEPRHFGAMSGMSFILVRHGMKKDALDLLRKAGAIYPHNPELEKLIDQLGLAVEGREI